jgi:hypothetical protein
MSLNGWLPQEAEGFEVPFNEVSPDALFNAAIL